MIRVSWWIVIVAVFFATGACANRRYASIPLEYQSATGFLTVPTSINGNRADLLFDIGSNISVLYTRPATDYGVTETIGNSRVAVLNGEVAMEVALASLVVGGMRVGRVPFHIFPAGSQFELHSATDGVLGLNAFSGQSIMLNGPAMSLIVSTDLQHCVDLVPLAIRGRGTELELRIDGSDRSVILDSGFPFSVLQFDPSIHNSLPSDQSTVVDMMGNSGAQLKGPIGVTIGLHDGSSIVTKVYSGEENRLGSDFLSKVRTVIDLRSFVGAVYTDERYCQVSDRS